MRTLTLSAVFALSLAGALASPPLRAASEWDRNGFDQDDLDALERRHPELHARFLHGEQQLRLGAPQAATEAFEAVTRGAPESALASRRACQALTELGHRAAALAACQASVERKPTAVGFRAFVHALMSGSPTPEELVLATELAAAARKRMQDQPWSLAAVSDIAERIGDEHMLQEATLELERIAPGHYETQRARRALDDYRLSGWAWGGWIGIGALLVTTAGHAAASALKAKRAGRALRASPLVLGLIAALYASPAAAEEAPSAPPPGTLSKWPVNDANPVQSLPTSAERDRNPLEFGYHLMDLADKADIARKQGNFRAVGQYYEAIAVAVPDRAIGYRKSCAGYEQAGDLEKAIPMCRGALAGDGVELNDYDHFARLLFAKKDPLSSTDVEDLTQIAQHLKAEPGGMVSGLRIDCDLAERLDDVTRLEACAKDVARETPADPKLVLYRWGIAMKRENYAEARQLIQTAREKALLPAGIEIMERATAEQSSPLRRIARGLRRNFSRALGFAAIAAVLCAFIAVRRRARPRLA